MSLNVKQFLIATLSLLFVASLVFVQYEEVTRRRQEAGLDKAHAIVPETSRRCVECHGQTEPGIVDHWEGSTHAEKGVGCYDCHAAKASDPDAFEHEGFTIATIVTPLDCAQCHPQVYAEFKASHHAKAGDILDSLDNRLAKVVEGAALPFAPHSPLSTMGATEVNGLASLTVGCLQCHGSKVALRGNDDSLITVDDLAPDASGRPTNLDAVGNIARDAFGKPIVDPSTWPNTGIGRINLDGSLGSCSACHSRHDFSPRRARQPENCGKCHLGPDHPQKEIYEESKHGVAYRDLKDHMNLDAKDWVLGEDYTQAPTCATCHMSGHAGNEGRITHDPGKRISWTNRPPVSLLMDTNEHHEVIEETDPVIRRGLIDDSWQDKRARMKAVCSNCHTDAYVNNFYTQYDDFVVLYNEKYGKPGTQIMAALLENGLRTKPEFDEEVEWTWFYLWHHEGRRARHGAAMMAPDYAHWHGMFEVAERWYLEFIPQVREMCEHGREEGKAEAADKVLELVDDIMSRPEHEWKGEGR
ncbi:MAG: multiheme c-type cytochrome [Planctomycetota bacterium]|nr:multiheme c-type cytochrome [Planctomycetota bacterium]